MTEERRLIIEMAALAGENWWAKDHGYADVTLEQFRKKPYFEQSYKSMTAAIASVEHLLVG